MNAGKSNAPRQRCEPASGASELLQRRQVSQQKTL
jgi:hypothetical protein